MPPHIASIPARTCNYTPGRGGCVPEYIIVHYTGTAASARNNALCFANNQMSASAHWFVDGSGTVYASVPEAHTAWHAGNWPMNQRAVGIEVVSPGWDFTPAEVDELTWLVQDVAARWGIPAERVLRHHDVPDHSWGQFVDPYKRCPAPYVDSWPKWAALHARITAQGYVPQAAGSAAEYSERVLCMQRELNVRLGAFGLAPIEADGYWGPQTQAAVVRLYQASCNVDYGACLEVDGVAGALTRAVQAAHPVGLGYEVRGNDVWSVKAALVGCGHELDVAQWEWGADDETALRAHQNAHALAVDGICGPASWTTLVPLACA